MTVAEFKSLLEDAAVDPFGEIKFYDKDGNQQEATLTNYGPTTHISPSQPADPAYLKFQLQIPG